MALVFLCTCWPGQVSAEPIPYGERHFAELAPRAARPTTEHSAAQALPRVDDPYLLDGRLDESFWRQALVWELAFERKAKLNARATQRTLFLAAATGEELRFAFLALDDRIDRLRAPLTDRLSVNPSGDYVWVALAPLGDERSAYYFLYLNARNVQADSFYEDGSAEDHRFDLAWESGAHLDVDAWSVEFRVPFSSLRFTPGAAWRIGAARRQTREFAYFFWPLPIDPDESCFVCKYSAVKVDPPQIDGISLEAIPFALASRQETVAGRDERIAGGIDTKWRPSPTWVVDATLAPDFSQVESDELQLTNNLRFTPSVAERRPFFLERTDLFSAPLPVAYTRSILDPDFGLRATGRAGANTVAVLTARDSATLLTFPGVFGASTLVLEDIDSQVTLASGRRELGRAKAALLLTDRRYSGGRNTVVSLDTQVPLDKTWKLELQAVASRTRYPGAIADEFDQPEDAFSGFGGWARIEHEGRHFTHRWTLEAVDEHLRADTGFIQQVDYQRVTATEWWHNWVENGFLRDHGLFIEAFATRSGGRTRDWEVWVGADWTLRGETYLDIGWVEGEDTVSSGRLPYRRALFIYSSSPTRWLSFSGRASHGTAIDYALERSSDLTSIQFSPRLELFDRLTISATARSYELSDHTLLQRQRLLDVRAELQLTPRLGIRHIVQWDRVEHPDDRYRALAIPRERNSLTHQPMLRYRLDHGTAAYLGVYARRTKDPAERRDRGAFLKLNYRLSW